MKTENQTKFHAALVAAYTDLFATNPEYAYSASKTTPEGLADRMLAAAVSGSINEDGEGVRRACVACGIPHTLKAIFELVGYGTREAAKINETDWAKVSGDPFEIISAVQSQRTPAA